MQNAITITVTVVALTAMINSNSQAQEMDAQTQARLQQLLLSSQAGATPSPGSTTTQQLNLSQAQMQRLMQIATAAPANVVMATAPKNAGVIRIGVAQPKAQMGQGNPGANVAEPLRTTLIQYLSGPKFEVIPIAAMLPVQIDAEAKQKECDYLLYTGISQKTSSGGMGIMRKAMPMASMIPMMGALGGSMGGVVAATAAGAAMSGAAGLGSSVVAKSEISFDYKLLIPGNDKPILANSTKAKAKQDGEDIISPIIEQVATAVLAELTHRLEGK